MKIDLRALWQDTIPSPPEFDEVMGELFDEREPTQFMPRQKFKIDLSFPPIFLYQEARGSHNSLDTYSYYGGGSSKSLIMGLAAHRDIVSFSGKLLQNKERGDILNAFCCIEFVVDALVCIKYGVFDDKITYQELKLKYMDDGETTGELSSFTKRLQFLRSEKGTLSNQTNDLLIKARNIRNSLAHQYLPLDNFGLTDVDISRYGGVLPAINAIYNGAWYYLLKDYVTKQVHVARWLATRIPIAE